MPTLAIMLGAAAVAAWVYLLLGRAWFWRVRQWSEWGKLPAGGGPSVVAIVPARNEAATIARAVTSLLQQEYHGELRVIVVDDESDDGTAEAARMAHSCLARVWPDRVGIAGQPKIILAKPRPQGWSGKVWAMQQGVEAARELAPTYFLFTDADVVHEPNTLATLVTIAEKGDYDLTSFMVRLHCQSVPERLLIPAFVFFFFMIYPPRWVADRQRGTAGAAGGCMLVRREALERAGGLASIRSEVIDDCALARLLKSGPSVAAQDARRASNVWLGMTPESKSLREYRSFGDIGRTIARTAFNQLHHSTILLAGALAGMAIAFVAPIALLVYPVLFRSGPAWSAGVCWSLGATAWALMLIAYSPMVRFYRLNLLWAASLPGAACFYMGATVWSAIKYWTGRGGQWKGRTQDQRAHGARHNA